MQADVLRRLRALLKRLTPRERQAFEAMLEGKGNREIAALLGISAWTAQFHASNALHKFGASGRADLFARIIRGALCPPPGGFALVIGGSQVGTARRLAVFFQRT